VYGADRDKLWNEKLKRIGGFKGDPVRMSTGGLICRSGATILMASMSKPSARATALKTATMERGRLAAAQGDLAEIKAAMFARRIGRGCRRRG
jgi:hypothetical protein